MFKDISYLEFWQPFCSVEWNQLCNISRGHYEDSSVKLFKFRAVVKEKMPFKDKSYLELWQPFCSAERNHLCNFSKRCYDEQFCEILLNLDQWLRRKCRLKIFLI